MPGTTPQYGWPYQTLGDPPHGPNLGQQLALAIEGDVAIIDGRVSTVEALAASLDIDRGLLRGGATAATRHEGAWKQANPQGFNSGVAAKVKFDGTPDRTTNDVIVSGTGNTDFALQRTGPWLAVGQLRGGGTGGAERSLFTQFNGATRGQINTGGAIGWTGIVTAYVLCTAVNQNVNVQFYQDSGGTINSTPSLTHFSLHWLGRD